MPSQGPPSPELRNALRTAITTGLVAAASILSAAELEAQDKAQKIRWGTVVEEAPNPAIVTSAEVRRRIVATRYPWLVRHRKTGIEMVLIPPGDYQRGATPNDRAARATERPRHRVRITQPFYLGRFEVTNGQFRRWNDKHDSSTFGVVSLDGDRQPAVRISWKSADAYCRAYGLRLPTSAEWEYAARADTTTRYPWGDDPRGGAGQVNVDDPACADPYPVTAPVGSFKANGFGLHDMLGNAWEWCWDFYEHRRYTPFGDRPVDDPVGPDTGILFVGRGGSFTSKATEIRLSALGIHRGSRYDRGFRVVKVPAGSDPLTKARARRRMLPPNILSWRGETVDKNRRFRASDHPMPHGNAVGIVRIKSETKPGYSTATCVLVAPRVFVTARHVFENWKRQAMVSFGFNGKNPRAITRTVTAIETRGKQHDFAIGIMDRPITKIPPIKLISPTTSPADLDFTKTVVGGYNRDTGLGEGGNVLTWDRGCVSAREPDQNGRVLCGAACYPGISGGPTFLYNRKTRTYEWVGILVESGFQVSLVDGIYRFRSFYLDHRKFRAQVLAAIRKHANDDASKKQP